MESMGQNWISDALGNVYDEAGNFIGKYKDLVAANQATVQAGMGTQGPPVDINAEVLAQNAIVSGNIEQAAATIQEKVSGTITGIEQSATGFLTTLETGMKWVIIGIVAIAVIEIVSKLPKFGKRD